MLTWPFTSPDPGPTVGRQHGFKLAYLSLTIFWWKFESKKKESKKKAGSKKSNLLTCDLSMLIFLKAGVWTVTWPYAWARWSLPKMQAARFLKLLTCTNLAGPDPWMASLEGVSNSALGSGEAVREYVTLQS